MTSSNTLVRQSYHRAVAFVKRQDDRHLTQREYLDATFGVNPRTGKAYNERTLRKWLTGERKADKPVAKAQRGGGTFNVSFQDTKGQVFSANVANTFETSRLDLYTPQRQADFKRTAKKSLEERFVTREGAPQPLPRPGETPHYKRLKSTRNLKPLAIRPVNARKQVAILERKKRLAA